MSEALTVGGKTARELKRELKDNGIDVGPYVREELMTESFLTLLVPQVIELVEVTIADLGLSEYPTTAEVYEAARSLGLEACPFEATLEYRIAKANLPESEWASMAVRYPDDAVYVSNMEIGGRHDEQVFTTLSMPNTRLEPNQRIIFQRSE